MNAVIAQRVPGRPRVSLRARPARLALVVLRGGASAALPFLPVAAVFTLALQPGALSRWRPSCRPSP